MAERGSVQKSTTGLRDEMNVCQLCGALENLSLCGGCKGTWYCSKDHQRKDWKAHKQTCKKSKTPTTHAKSTLQEKMPNECADEEHTDAVSAEYNSDPDSPTKSQVEESTAGSIDLTPREYENIATRGEKERVDDSEIAHQHLATAAARDTAASCSSNEDVGRDTVQVEGGDSASASTTVSTKKGKKLGKSSKKRYKFDQGNLVTISEDGPPPERYYLNQSTHRINLPPAARSASGAHSQASAMGMEDSLSPAESREQYLSVLRSRFDVLAKYAVECLTRYGICVIDKFLGDITSLEILKEVQQIQGAGVMKQGQLVHGPSSSSSNKYIRGDMITWVDGTEPRSENIHFLISCMDAVMLKSASQLETCTVNERTKAMVACYPGRGTRYVRHVDNPHGDGRCITCIYYLNKNWDVRQHGGLLRIYPEGEDRVANIEPKLDRLVLFWSDRRNPHEVESAMRERYAITVWYYDAEERAQALKRFKGSSQTKSMKSHAVPLLNVDQT